MTKSTPRWYASTIKGRIAICALSLAAVLVLGAASSQAAPGELDPGFGDGGTAAGPAGQAYSVALQSDGKIVVAGGGASEGPSRFILARFQMHGTADPAFGGEGNISTGFGASDDSATDVAIQPDGKIVAAGTSYRSTGAQLALARYNADGSLDTSFGTGGKLRTSFGVTTNVLNAALAIRSDGKIVVAGTVGTYSGGGNAEYDIGLARYRPDGTLDPSFGSGGKLTTGFGGEDSAAQAIVLQPDGKAVVAGFEFNASGPGVQAFALARFNTDGSLDSGFGSGGKVTTEIGAAAVANGVALQADGKIVAGGAALVFGAADELSSDFALARYGQNGTLDPAFGSGGVVTTEVGSGDGNIEAVALRTDGKIVAVGASSGTDNFEFGLARYRPDGSLDPSFGTDGQVQSDFGSFGQANDLALQADGKIVAAGQGGQSGFMVARYLDAQATCLVPDVKGKVLAKATRAISGAHCSVGTIKRAYSRRVGKGRVISQNPAASTRAAEGAKVSLTVSKGKRSH